MNIRKRMTLNYRVIKKDIVEALDDIQAFEEKMVSLLLKYPTYKYNLDLYEEEGKWIVDLKIDKDEEQSNIEGVGWNSKRITTPE